MTIITPAEMAGSAGEHAEGKDLRLCGLYNYRLPLHLLAGGEVSTMKEVGASWLTPVSTGGGGAGNVGLGSCAVLTQDVVYSMSRAEPIT